MITPFLKKVKPLPYIPVLVAPWILLAPLIFGRQAIFWGTPFLQFVPWRAYAWDVLLHGQLPLWNPLVGMGAPLLANYQSALFYPPNWLLLALQLIGGIPAHAWGQAILIGLHLMWAGIGMIWLTRSLKFSDLGQTVSALAFSLSTYLVTRSGFLSINAAVSWMPWVIWAINRSIDLYRSERPKGFLAISRAWLPFVVCLAMQLLSGHAQSTWYTISLAGLWAVVRLAHRDYRREILPFAAGLLLAGSAAIAASAIQLIPTAEYLLQSQRATNVDFSYAMNFSIEGWSLVTFIVPLLYGSPAWGNYWLNIYYWETAVYIGALPFLLAIFAAIAALFKRRESSSTEWDGDNRVFAIFLLIVSIVSIVFALGKNTPVFPFLYRYVPTFDMFQAPARFSIWAVFCLALLAGMGVKEWRRPEKRGLYWSRLLTAGAFAITAGSGVAWLALQGVKLTFIQAMAMAGFWLLGAGVLTLTAPPQGQPTSPAWWRGAAATWVALDLLVVNWGMLPGTDLSLYRDVPENRESVAALSNGHRLFIADQDEEEIKFERFLRTEMFAIQEDWDNFRAVYLPDANILDGIASANNFDPLVPARYARWMEYVNTLPEGERTSWLAWMDVSLVEKSDPGQTMGIDFIPISESARFRWSTCPEFAASDEEAWQRTQTQMAANDPSAAHQAAWVVLENVPEAEQSCVEGQTAEIQQQNETAGKMTLQVNAAQDGWLIVSDTFYPGWRAAIDGNPTAIFAANSLFRAVGVPAGEHQVVFEFRPFSFTFGAILSILTWIGLAVISRTLKVVNALRVE
ncbi:MAG TPA: YfhO family protein [Anaerolineaceae bacterium]|nr:YfhO family protein [Anaerolineaceae bacterium]